MLQEHREQKSLGFGPCLQGASDRAWKTLVHTEGLHKDAKESVLTAKWKEQTFSALVSLQIRRQSLQTKEVRKGFWESQGSWEACKEKYT